MLEAVQEAAQPWLLLSALPDALLRAVEGASVERLLKTHVAGIWGPQVQMHRAK